MSTSSSEADWTHEIIRTNQIQLCRQIMDKIMKGHRPVAIDCEGMNLGRNGRMTLIQICTRENEVYLIDLVDEEQPEDCQPAMNIIYEGYVKKMLESSANEKIMHGCNHDSGALFHQFGVQLWPSRVFDTQVADMAIQVSSGVCFPKKNKLNRIAEIYHAPTTQKRRAHASAIKLNHSLWNHRPLTQEMIIIASYDVLTLCPKLYNQLRRRLDQEKAWEDYRQMVGWQIDLQIEPKAVLAGRKLELDARVGKLLQDMHSRYQSSTKVSTLSADEMRVLRTMRGRGNWSKWSRYIKECSGMQTVVSLEEKALLFDIDLLEQKKAKADGTVQLTYREGRRLNVLCRHPTATVKQAATHFKKRLQMAKEE